jgi:ElaB/YqjD/DUF883 family membrane-anchored ribosome-binding protein
MSKLPPLSPLPKKPGQDDSKDPSEEENFKPSDLFKDSISLTPPPLNPPQNYSPPASPPLSLDAIPAREEPQYVHPGLYQGTKEQMKYFDDGQSPAETTTFQSEPTMGEDIFTLKKQLAEKEKELSEIFGTFQEIKSAYETMNVQNQNLKTQIDSLKASLDMKETHIKTLGETIKMKDEQLALKNDQIKMKEDQIGIYQKTLEEKSKAFDELKASCVDKAVLAQKEAIVTEREASIQALQAQVKIMEEEAELLKGDIDAADEEVEQLTDKIQKIQNEAKDAVSNTRVQVIDKMKKILGEGLHNVNITAPSIEDLAELDLYSVKTSVNLKVSCSIEAGNPKHTDLQQEFQAFDNISLRAFDERDRWMILKDNEVLFMAIAGIEPNKFLAFSSEDPKHIKFFNTISMESWLRGRKV